MTSQNDMNGREGTPPRRTQVPRMSVPSAREELERESRAYSSNQGRGSWSNESPSEMEGRARAARQLTDHDYMAPLRGDRAATQRNYRGMDGAARTGSFRAQEPSRAHSAADHRPLANAREEEALTGQRRYADTSSRHYRSDAQERPSRPSVRRKQEAKRPSVRKRTEGGTAQARPSEPQDYRERANARFAAEPQAASAEDASAYSRYENARDYRAARTSSRYSRNDQAAHERYRNLEEVPEDREPGMRGAAEGVGRALRGATGTASRFVPMGTPGNAPKDHLPNPMNRARKLIIGAAAAIAVIAVGTFGFQNWDANRPVHIMLNDQEVTVEGGQRSVEGLLDAGTVSVTPGNYVAVNGDTLREGEGNRASAKINGNDVEDLSTHLYDGDQVKVTNGTDITEPYTDTDEKEINFKTKIEGAGPMHVYTSKGEKGTKVTRTGQESGISTEVVTKEAKDTVMTKYHVDTKGDKVIALTFDDGPWPTTTNEILDILKKNDAKATFFTIGQQIASHTDSVKRMMEDGHQICTHTYDHAAGSGKGVNITYMSKKEQQEEIKKGYECIKEVTGADASTVVRLPGGNLNEDTAANIKDLITCEAGWSLDTQDWSRPGADHIYNVLMQAEGGSIILMHDGGGDRSQTVEAVKRALPKLAEKGYKFVTLDEMLEKYPYEGSSDASSDSSDASDSQADPDSDTSDNQDNQDNQ
ncbi:MAG: polysaccharide deacetylase family protein [Coriobacteriia bacterium]|nr:polysaccharide deacetylase family protein [Coriobacteriia bacterium]